jgi:hypothetical protein
VLGGSEGAGTLYMHVINGHRCYTQGERSAGDNNREIRPSAGRLVPRFAVPGHGSAGTSLRFSPAASTSINSLSRARPGTSVTARERASSTGRGALTPAKHRYRRARHDAVTLTLVDNRGNLQSTTLSVTVHAG